MYKGELGTANAHKILLKDIGKLFLPEAPVPHCRIPEQWGRGAGTNVTFPISFPNNCFTAIGMLVRDSKGEVAMSQPSKTGVQFHSYEDPWNWISVGN